MNTSPLSSLSLRKRSKSGLALLEPLLELMPACTLIVDEQGENILFANGKITELTAFTKSELAGMPLVSLIPGLDRKTFKQKIKEETSETRIICRRNMPAVEVRFNLSALDPECRHYLIYLELESDLERKEAEQQRHANLQAASMKLLVAFQQDKLDEALKIALEAGSQLTGASLLTIYQAEGSNLTLIRSAVCGPAELLPAKIHPNDLISLQKPFYWNSKTRAITSLHRAARASNLAFLASAPLGQTNAMIGLIAAAGDFEFPAEETLSVLELLATGVSALLQTHTLSTNLEQTVQNQGRDVMVGAAVKEGIQEGIVLLSPELTIKELNPAAETILGYAANEVVGWPYHNIIVGADNLIPPFIQDQSGSSFHNVGSIRLYRRNGLSFLANVRTLPVFFDERLETVIIFIEDQSQEEQFRLRNQQLEQRAVIGEVSAIFAHEVRNPINNISTGLQLMADQLPSDHKNQAVIGRLQVDCDRLEELMKSTLSFVRTMEYKMGPVDLKEYFPRLIERWRPHLVRVNIIHSLQIDPETPRIEGDMRALEQVWNNLISNAIQAIGQEGGSLTLKVRPVITEENFQRVEVIFTDTGLGIPDEIRERIFEPFFTTNRSGTGLGLPIAKHIITTHKGTIKVISIPGATSFQIRLPIFKT
jgi:two-component system, NtrC family, sensor histidine kinase AtoS